jgi:C4-dicarboxylate-specific signal transduction histidine kinase
VLHNVGNVLNSVIVSANLCSETLRRSRAPGLGKAVALMRAQQDRLGAFLTQDAQGRQLPSYLSMLAEQLEKERSSMSVELERLQKNIAHVAAIVGAQQSFAKSAGASEPAVPAEIFDEALTLSSGSLDCSGISIVTDYQPLPPLVLDRHKIIQILVNLLTNAVHAVKAQQPDEPKLILRIWQPVPERVRFAVNDNGVGISADHQVRIFSHGFTTKKEGHGFGLHASACFAAEMGGTLSCQSEGRGRGSSFVLELPFEKAEVQNVHLLRA